MLELKNIINQMDTKDIFITFNSNTKQYTFFSVAHGTSSKTDHVLGVRSSDRNLSSDRRKLK